MKFSKFGTKFTRNSGILELMEDLGNALKGIGGDVNMLGAGNPAHIPEVQKICRKRMEEILKNGNEFEELISNYEDPKGSPTFIKAFVDFLNSEYGWGLSEKNIMITSGTQSGYFILLNLLGGDYPDGTKKKILFPMVPEYIGYADQGIGEDYFISIRPIIKEFDDHSFKYGINFDKLDISSEISAVCISRPTNPTGNVITDEELDILIKMTKDKDIPLIVDNAYGEPIPNVLFTDSKLKWVENMVLSFSLSKFGLPTSRTGIFVANEDIIQAMCKVDAILSLSNSGFGQKIVEPWLRNSKASEISTKYIKPFYKEKREYFFSVVEKVFDHTLPYFVHKNEGAFFVWMWFKDIPITTKELYERLKKRNTIVVPGEYFFPGMDEDNWQHKNECIRINFARSKKEIDDGMQIIADEVKKAYST